MHHAVCVFNNNDLIFKCTIVYADALEWTAEVVESVAFINYCTKQCKTLK